MKTQLFLSCFCLSLTLLAVTVHAQEPFVWEHRYGSSNNERGIEAIRTSDGGYLMAGITDHFLRDDYEAYLIKLDQDMNIEWSKNYSDIPGDFFSNVIQTDDDGYLLVGSRRVDNQDLNGVLIKTFKT